MSKVELDIARSLMNMRGSIDSLKDLLAKTFIQYEKDWHEGYSLAVTNSTSPQPFTIDHRIAINKRLDSYINSITVVASTSTAGDFFTITNVAEPLVNTAYYQTIGSFVFDPPRLLSKGKTVLDFVWTNIGAQAKTVTVVVERLL